MTFYVQAPIFVFREFMRHRIASYNEESGRYRELRPVFYVPAENRNLKNPPGSYVFEHVVVEVGSVGSKGEIRNRVGLRSDDLYGIRYCGWAHPTG